MSKASARTPREKLEHELNAFIDLGRDEWVQRLMRRRGLYPKDLRRRNDRWVTMGKPEYDSPEWLAELERLRKLEPRKGKQEVPPLGTEYRRMMLIAARQAAGLPVELAELPGQNHYSHTKQQRAEAARMYRWLWRNFPGQLKACDPALRALIRKAGGVA
jgi:hypothetical protein